MKVWKCQECNCYFTIDLGTCRACGGELKEREVDNGKWVR